MGFRIEERTGLRDGEPVRVFDVIDTDTGEPVLDGEGLATYGVAECVRGDLEADARADAMDPFDDGDRAFDMGR